MKFIFFGDIFGRPGREALARVLPRLIEAHDPDFVVVNGENASHGNGILPEMVEDFVKLGVDVVTTGNHAWDQKQIIPYMATSQRIIRPANYPDHPTFKVPGRGVTVAESRNKRRPGLRLGVVQVMGRVFMDSIDCPFRTAERELDRLDELGVKHVLVDMHGEASSEKQAMAHFLDGKATAVLGTHSHVQTADERILPGGTAAITDVGMTGCYDSVIGVKKEISIQKFLTKRPMKYEPADGLGGYGCVIVTADDRTGRATSITRLREAVVRADSNLGAPGSADRGEGSR